MSACLYFVLRRSTNVCRGQYAQNFRLLIKQQFSTYSKRQLLNQNDFFERKNFRRRFCGRNILYAGILTWLGFKEEEKEDPLISIMKLGILNTQKGEYDKAESILHLALKLAQERADMQAQRYIFDLLANNAYQKGDFPKAEKLFVEVTKGLITSGMEPNDNAIIEISLKLATIYGKLNEIEKAEAGFQFCIGIQQGKLSTINLDDVEALTELEKDTALLFAMSMDWYAKYLLDKGKFKEAEAQYEKALSISEKLNGFEHPQTLVLINDIGSTACLNKDFEKAEQYFNKAIEIGINSGTPDLPAFYCNLGSVYMKKGEMGKAYISCSKALKSAKRLDDKIAVKEALECLDEIRKPASKKV